MPNPDRSRSPFRQKRDPLSRSPFRQKRDPRLGVLLAVLTAAVGCSPTAPPTDPAPPPPANDSTAAPAETAPPPFAEVTAESLLSARLPADDHADGWVRLFDGHTLMGWESAGDVNWRIEDGTIVADDGDVALLCTALPWTDYELSLQFRATPQTNSGVFLRTKLQVADESRDCYEINIAPPDNPFPTASVVKRRKKEGVEITGDWQTMNLVMRNNKVVVSVDGDKVNTYIDPDPIRTGRIGLQHNTGRIEFRDIRVRPFGLINLIDDDLTAWKRYDNMDGEFAVDDGSLSIRGGKGQLETRDTFGDFTLLARYRLARPDTNSGIFFRCIPGDEMMGYECQLNDATIGGDPMRPADTGTGGIFRRRPARIIAADPDATNTLLLKTHGNTMAAWVNGLQVSQWTDTRDPNPNPRRGRRDDPGTIILQAHDPETDATLEALGVRRD